MTEAEWLACTDPTLMVEFLRGNASDRKLRLFAVACCYRLWDWSSDECRRKLILFERHADEPEQPDVGDIEFGSAIEASQVAAPEVVSGAFDAVRSSLWNYWDVLTAAEVEETGVEALASPAWLKAIETQVYLVHELVNNPFRPRKPLPMAVLSWNENTVVRLAQRIYTDRAFDRLPILADALEDAGCDNADILAHCRGSGVHVRGCWVVDLLLGKP